MDHRAAAVALGFAMLTACARSAQPPPVVCPASEQVDLQAHLVDPAPGATGVPTTIGSIAFVVTVPELRLDSVYLVSAPQPAGIALANITTDPSGVSHVAVPPLAAHTNYQAYATGGLGPPAFGCPQEMSVAAPLGAFTTQ